MYEPDGACCAPRGDGRRGGTACAVTRAHRARLVMCRWPTRSKISAMNHGKHRADARSRRRRDSEISRRTKSRPRSVSRRGMGRRHLVPHTRPDQPAIEHLDNAESISSPSAKITPRPRRYEERISRWWRSVDDEEAIGTGLRGEVFLIHQDLPAAGRIEHNIGNICWRRDRYQEAEQALPEARARTIPRHGRPPAARHDRELTRRQLHLPAEFPLRRTTLRTSLRTRRTRWPFGHSGRGIEGQHG